MHAAYRGRPGHLLASALASGECFIELPIKFAVRVDAAAHLPERVLAPAALLVGKPGWVDPAGTVARADRVGKVAPTDRVDLAGKAGLVDTADTADMAGKVADSLLCACHS